MLATLIPRGLPGDAVPNGPDGLEAGRKNSDDALSERIREALACSGYDSLRAITVGVRDGMVSLSGSVASWYLRQVAQEVAMAITGPGRITNDLNVVYGMSN